MVQCSVYQTPHGGTGLKTVLDLADAPKDGVSMVQGKAVSRATRDYFGGFSPECHRRCRSDRLLTKNTTVHENVNTEPANSESIPTEAHKAIDSAGLNLSVYLGEYLAGGLSLFEKLMNLLSMNCVLVTN
ncbi:hypothetical protein ElyMa_004624700 [Elysia marginata]|uniref:Uncharacterized protein n=1 Tax=Elysia marginata TaxID=1093978 RepID=A0AAV4I371_9GAST|nr:hypothetical protein ElyMa_004624700 [Elysia marginata]